MFDTHKHPNSRWLDFIRESVQIATLWFAGVILFMGFRIFFLIHFKERITSNLDSEAIIATLKAGFAFDSAAAGVCFSVAFILNCVLQPMRLGHWVSKVRLISGWLFFITAILLCVTSVTYITEYGSQFNFFMFEGLNDDQQAIALTVIEQYKPWGSLLSLLILIALAFKLNTWVDRTNFSCVNRIYTTSIFKRVIIVSLIIILFVCAIRGSFETRPASRKWSAVTTDAFVNNLVINPFRSFVYAIKDYNDLQSFGLNGHNPYLPKSVSEIENPLASLQQKTQGPLLTAPSQIFFIVMESYDAWPLQEKYASLNLTTQLSNLASKGIYLNNVLPAASSTMNSLSSLISGIAFSGVNMSRIGPQKPMSKLSLFNQLEQLGYQSRFYYGGLLSWQNIGEYVNSQGVDKVFSAADAGGKGSAGVWGIDDGQLFDLVNTKTTLEQKSFNLIMSGSYHGPFNLDLDKYGYSLKTSADYPKAIQALDNDLLDPYVLGHLWYADKMLGQFVQKMEQRYPDALFVITGDHYSRRYLHHRPNLYELTHVPLVIYGKGVNPNWVTKEQLGSHMDIAPTILNLIAPTDTPFYSMGHSLLNQTKERTVFGFQTVRKPNQLWRGDFSSVYEYQHVTPEDRVTLAPRTQQPFEPIDAATEKSYNHYMATAWQLLTKGMD